MLAVSTAWLAALGIGTSATGQASSATASPPPSGALAPDTWKATARADVAAYAAAVRANYVYAVYPDPRRWKRQFDRTLQSVEAKLALVHDEAGYQAILKYLSVTLHDAHVGIRFKDPVSDTQWPGFLARFDNGKYRIAASQIAAAHEGAVVTACDGKPVSQWIDTISRYEVGMPTTLETTRNIAAQRLFVDRHSPLRERPTRCTIGGVSVPLDWRSVDTKALGSNLAIVQGEPSREVSTRMIGQDGAWVKLGFFEPTNADQAKAFHTAIDTAPGLRNKRFIILDVRGNGGGPYNWFMGYLRGLYGQPYADYYATARLRIRAVYRLSKAQESNDQRDETAATDFHRPPDPPYEINGTQDEQLETQARAADKPYYQAAPISIERGMAPANPVKAKVYVLTDYGCGSACIGFVDELKLFPGVQQIGLPTFVDSRSGTAAPVPLPSGEATAFIATMTRDGRVRGDNVPQVPSIRFTGDMRDNAAVEDWVLHQVTHD